MKKCKNCGHEIGCVTPIWVQHGRGHEIWQHNKDGKPKKQCPKCRCRSPEEIT